MLQIKILGKITAKQISHLTYFAALATRNMRAHFLWILNGFTASVSKCLNKDNLTLPNCFTP